MVIRPDYAKSYINLGKVYLKEGEPKPAITNFVTIGISPRRDKTKELLLWTA
jgi:hypothetical protein